LGVNYPINQRRQPFICELLLLVVLMPVIDTANPADGVTQAALRNID
jgi:hypothetical protein